LFIIDTNIIMKIKGTLMISTKGYLIINKL